MGRKTSATPKSVSKKKTSHTQTFGKASASARILWAAMVLEKLSKNPSLSRKQVVALASVKATTEPCVLSMLKMEGSIAYDKTTITLSELGRSKGDTSVVPANNNAVQAYLKTRYLTTKTAVLFDVLRNGRTYDRQSLGETLGNSNKTTMASALSKMAKVGLVEYPDADTVRLTNLCFPHGRPT